MATIPIRRGEASRRSISLGVAERKTRRLDLSILDYRMPDLSGIETFRQLVLELPGTGAIFVSGEASISLEERVLNAGGFALVEKPLKLPRLRHVLEKFRREAHGDS